MHENLTFPSKDGPYYFSNFVQTLDGKTYVSSDPDAYWPLGSEADYLTMQQLRRQADVLIHGSKTAGSHRTLTSLAKYKVAEGRAARGETGPYLYVVVSAHPDTDLISYLSTPPEGVETLLATTVEASIPENSPQLQVARFGRGKVNLLDLSAHLQSLGKKQVLLEGGPTLFGQFVASNLVDELFITLAPKVIGSEAGNTLTMVEGVLLPPASQQRFELISSEALESELYLRYRKIN